MGNMKMFRNAKGFTLLELLVAVSLLAIGLLAAASMQGVAINSSGIANTLTVATTIGEEVLEKMLTLRSTDPILNADTAGEVVFDLDPDSAANTITIPGAGPCGATYTIDAGSPVPNITTIVVTITVGTPILVGGIEVGTHQIVFTGYKRV